MNSPQLLAGVDALKGQVSSVNPSNTKSSRVCRHFVRGRCTWGTACRFSHEAERGEGTNSNECSVSATPKVSSPTVFSAAAGQLAPGQLPHSQSGNHLSTQQSWIGAQQAQLQQQRHAILRAAMEGQFAVRPIVSAEGHSHHTIHLTTLPSPEIAIQLLGEQQLRLQLHQLEMDDRVREGGLHYLIGEPSVFWSMIRHWHQTGTTTSPKWDAMLSRARQTQQVDCMFFRSAASCLSPSCPFDHVPRTIGAGGPQVMSMATSNAILQRMPSLGFGSSERLSDMHTGTPTLPVQPLQPQAAPFTFAPAAPQMPAQGLTTQASGTAALFQSTPTLDELAAAASGTTEHNWKHTGSKAHAARDGEEQHLSKALWGMLSVAEPQPVAVTTAPSGSSIW